MEIDLKVSKHPSGRLTLTKREQTEMLPSDCDGDLFSNSDAGSFYRAVARMVHILHREGHNVQYEDVPY